MKREAYDKVQGYLKRTGTEELGRALKATKINAGTYYRQKKLVEQSSSPTYDIEVLHPQAAVSHVRPGIVALVGAPADLADLAAMLARVLGGGP